MTILIAPRHSSAKYYSHPREFPNPSYSLIIQEWLSNSSFVPAVGKIPAKICPGVGEFLTKIYPRVGDFPVLSRAPNGKSLGLDGEGGVHTND